MKFKHTKKLIDTILEKYWDADEEFLLEHYPPSKPDTVKYSFLWGYGAFVTMLGTYAQKSGDKEAKAFLEKAMDKMELYRTDREGFYYYDSHPKVYGGAEPYYDDNAWCILALLTAYELFGDVKYLNYAKAATEYLFYGWNDKIGGIYWREYNCNSSNTCSSMPSAVCCLLLYKITKDKKYLDYAVKVYDWTVKHLRDTDGVYFDNINNDGVIGKDKYTYNTGTPIWAGALLYDITKDKKYLNDAVLSAKGGIKYFFEGDYNRSIPWFNVYLIQGVLELAKHADMKHELKVLNKTVDYAIKHAAGKDGLYNKDWKGKAKLDEYLINLDQLGTGECLALLEK